MKKYKIVAITQVHNEVRSGHLERFFKYLPLVVDEIVVYDDASSDGSWEYAKKFTPHVIRGFKNDFIHEREHKKILLEKALTLKPDFILSIDADEVVADPDGSKIQQLAEWVIKNNLDGATTHEINLWRSSSYKRIDSDYDAAEFLRFWKVVPNMVYSDTSEGLHRSPAPECVKNYKVSGILSLLHFGFSSDQNILSKYLRYSSLGQKGENLARFISEEKLITELVDKNLYPQGLWKEEKPPVARPVIEWLKLARALEPESKKPTISIVCLIFKSVEWLQFCYDQVLKYTDMSDKEFFFVANDATEEVKKYLRDNYIPHYILENSEEHKKEWYINNVYRAYNYGAKIAKGDYVLFINSDMGFSPNWVEEMFAQLTGQNCLSPRLVESGKLATGSEVNDDPCFEHSFGTLIEEYREAEFINYAEGIRAAKIAPEGASMPLLIKREDFWSVGGYPEGNIIRTSDIFHPIIAKQGDDLMSGDISFMKKLLSKGIIHETTYRCVVYHFQEGEKSTSLEQNSGNKIVEVIIANNSLNGGSKEKVLWNFLLDGLPNSAGVDQAITKSTEKTFESEAKEYVIKNFPQSKIVIQNASFIDLLDQSRYSVVYLQDNLRRMNRMSFQQEDNLEKADLIVANTFDTAASYPEFYCRIIPIGIDHNLFLPGDKQAARKEQGILGDKVAIFVGDLSEVKGWSKIKAIIEKRTDITWLIVNKNNDVFSAPNVKMYNKIPQEKLARLLVAADFFILGSPVETQCLAAMEACFTDTPVIMNLVGIFPSLSVEQRDLCGIFGPDFEKAIDQIYAKKFSPRQVMLEEKYTIEEMLTQWRNLIAEIKVKSKISLGRPIVRTGGGRRNLKKILMMLSNKNYLQTYAKKKFPDWLYKLILSTWRNGKNLKSKVLK